jgi:hypothetical protein
MGGRTHNLMSDGDVGVVCSTHRTKTQSSPPNWNRPFHYTSIERSHRPPTDLIGVFARHGTYPINASARKITADSTWPVTSRLIESVHNPCEGMPHQHSPLQQSHGSAWLPFASDRLPSKHLVLLPPSTMLTMLDKRRPLIKSHVPPSSTTLLMLDSRRSSMKSRVLPPSTTLLMMNDRRLSSKSAVLLPPAATFPKLEGHRIKRDVPASESDH